MKICKICNVSKELNEFHKNGKWFRNACRKCHNAKYQRVTGKVNTGRFKKGQKPINGFKKGQISWNKGKKQNPESKKALRIAQLGRKHSIQEIEKRRKSLIKVSASRAKYKRHSSISRRWSREIRKRDNYTCQHCKETNKKLHAHHILSWKDNEMLRFDLSNGISLCIPCHKKIHITVV